MYGNISKKSRKWVALLSIEKGFFQSEIRANAYRLKKETDDAEKIIVGVNKYAEEEEQPELLRIDGRIEIQQKKALKKLRTDRDSKKIRKGIICNAKCC